MHRCFRLIAHPPVTLLYVTFDSPKENIRTN
jgi:hypothetical protein